MTAPKDESDIRQLGKQLPAVGGNRRSEPINPEALAELKAAYIALETDAKYVFKLRG